MNKWYLQLTGKRDAGRRRQFSTIRLHIPDVGYCVPALLYEHWPTVAAMSSTPEIAALLFTFFFSFMITFNGVLQPFGQLGWWKWITGSLLPSTFQEYMNSTHYE